MRRHVASHAARALLALVLAGLAACRTERVRPLPDSTTVAEASSLPSPEYTRRVAFRVPVEDEVTDPARLASVRRGRALLRDTRDSLPAHVGNRFNCTTCHPSDGTQKNVLPWVGVYARYPQFRNRAGAVQTIEDAINDCFKRSMNGRAVSSESPDMRDMVAYLAFLSSGYPVGAQTDGEGLAQLKPLTADTAGGRRTYAASCASCHAGTGAGAARSPRPAPPLWGPQSFSVASGMARLRTAASFIRTAEPRNAPGTVTPQAAFDVAAFVTSQSRPDFRGKESDWPRGDSPPDVPYRTHAPLPKKKVGGGRPVTRR